MIEGSIYETGFLNLILVLSIYTHQEGPIGCVIQNFFDSYGCVPPKKLSSYIIKRYGFCLYSEYQNQKIDSFCVSYCLYILYLTKVLGIDFKSAVLNLYYLRFS